MRKTFWMMFVGVLSLGLAITACDSGSSGGDEPGDDCATVCAGSDCGTIGDCTCGACGDDEVCTDNMCEVLSEECATACDGKVCGEFDGCDCGGCGADEVCSMEGTECKAAPEGCEDACADNECGTFDGCECGTCEDGFECDEGMCVEFCEAVCAADGVPFECGDDGCGESCGECPSGDQYACEANACVCTPDCDGSVCGSDGCGGSCGDCADGETCSNGACFAGCAEIDFPNPLIKLNYLMIDGDGLAGHGLDVDLDPNTCAPEGNCEGGIDNALGGILGQVEQYIDVGAELEGAMVDGTIVLLAEMGVEETPYMNDGTEFPVYFYLGEITGDQAACDYQTTKCDYLVDPMSFDVETCMALISFDNATVNGGAFMAGGPDAVFSMSLDIEGIALTITAVNAQIVGDVTETDGVPTAIDNGIIGGAVPKALIMEAVDNLPDDLELPVSPELIKDMLDMFIQPDIDAGDEMGEGEPDGEFESASVGIQFGAIEGAISGFKAAE